MLTLQGNQNDPLTLEHGLFWDLETPVCMRKVQMLHRKTLVNMGSPTFLLEDMRTTCCAAVQSNIKVFFVEKETQQKENLILFTGPCQINANFKFVAVIVIICSCKSVSDLFYNKYFCYEQCQH